MYNREQSPLYIKSCNFAARITKMVKFLYENDNKKLAPLYDQVLRSGTSVMANVGESQFAQSRADFITKLHVALKEANETKNWLDLLHKSECLTSTQWSSITDDCKELIALLIASLNTAKRNSAS